MHAWIRNLFHWFFRMYDGLPLSAISSCAVRHCRPLRSSGCGFLHHVGRPAAVGRYQLRGPVAQLPVARPCRICLRPSLLFIFSRSNREEYTILLSYSKSAEFGEYAKFSQTLNRGNCSLQPHSNSFSDFFNFPAFSNVF